MSYTAAGNVNNNSYFNSQPCVCPTCGYCPTCGQKRPQIWTYGGGILGGLPNVQTIGGTGLAVGESYIVNNGEGHAISKGNMDPSCGQPQNNA